MAGANEFDPYKDRSPPVHSLTKGLGLFDFRLGLAHLKASVFPYPSWSTYGLGPHPQVQPGTFIPRPSAA